MDEAVAWVKRCPNPMPGPSDIDIRPLFDAAEIEKFLTPEAAKVRSEAKRWETLSEKSQAAPG
jgi:hypothetical protein